MMGMEASLSNSSSVEWLYTRAKTISHSPDRTLRRKFVKERRPDTVPDTGLRPINGGCEAQDSPSCVRVALIHSQVNVLGGEETGVPTQQSKTYNCDIKVNFSFLNGQMLEKLHMTNTQWLVCVTCAASSGPPDFCSRDEWSSPCQHFCYVHIHIVLNCWTHSYMVSDHVPIYNKT